MVGELYLSKTVKKKNQYVQKQAHPLPTHPTPKPLRGSMLLLTHSATSAGT